MPRTVRPTRTRPTGRRLATLVALVATACGNSSPDAAPSSTAGDGDVISVDVPGVTDDEIHFAVIGTRTNNPLGTCILDCYVDGITAYFDYRNSQGGVHGRKLVVSRELDDELSQNQVRALEVVTADDAFAVFSAAHVANGWADLAEAGIPLYVWAVNPAEMTGHEEIFGNREVWCIACTQRAAAHVADLADAEHVASLGYGIAENSRQCAQGAAESFARYGDEVGAESVYLNADLAFGLPNGIGPEVTAMKEAGVDLVIGCIDLNGMKTLAAELSRQGMDDVVLFHTNTYDHAFVAESGGMFDGDIIQATFRPFEAADNESLAAYKEWMERNGSELTEISMVGWINADLAYQGLVAAGPDFDRRAVIDATNEMTAYTADGLVQPIDWSRQHQPPTEDDPATHGPVHNCISLVRVVDGRFEILGDEDEPWTCWPGDTREWSEPETRDFE